MFDLLFPAHQQPAELVMPRMCPLHHPAPRRMGLLWTNFRFWHSAFLAMQNVVTFEHAFPYIGVVIARIQTEMVAAVTHFLRPFHRRCIQGLQRQGLVRYIGRRDHHGQGSPAPIAQNAALGAGFRPVHRTGAGGLSAQGGFGDNPVERLPLPSDADFEVVIDQHQQPGLLKHPGLGPLLEAPPDGRFRGVVLTRNRPPLTARAQNIDDAIENPTIRHRRTARRARGVFWSEQRRNQTPQIIRHMPYCWQRGLSSHTFPPRRGLTRKVYATWASFSGFRTDSKSDSSLRNGVCNLWHLAWYVLCKNRLGGLVSDRSKV